MPDWWEIIESLKNWILTIQQEYGKIFAKNNDNSQELDAKNKIIWIHQESDNDFLPQIG